MRLESVLFFGLILYWKRLPLTACFNGKRVGVDEVDLVGLGGLSGQGVPIFTPVGARRRDRVIFGNDLFLLPGIPLRSMPGYFQNVPSGL